MPPPIHVLILDSSYSRVDDQNIVIITIRLGERAGGQDVSAVAAAAPPPQPVAPTDTHNARSRMHAPYVSNGRAGVGPHDGLLQAHPRLIVV